jgi:hypothetical protein
VHGQALDVARFKKITGLSRKYAIPLLEHLDRERITRKNGDRGLFYSSLIQSFRATYRCFQREAMCYSRAGAEALTEEQ